MYKFSMSGHADRDEILERILKMSPRAVVLVHGEEESRNWFMDSLTESSPGTRVFDMNPGEEFLV
jgi:Cft2 family RNA processing exonuclease